MLRSCSASAASITSRPRAASSGVTKLGNQPSANRPTRRSSDGAIPPSQTSRRVCSGLGKHPQIVVVEVLAVVGQRSLGPGAAQHGQRLVEQLGPGAALDAECLLLVRVGDAEPEGR